MLGDLLFGAGRLVAGLGLDVAAGALSVVPSSSSSRSYRSAARIPLTYDNMGPCDCGGTVYWHDARTKPNPGDAAVMQCSLSKLSSTECATVTKEAKLQAKFGDFRVTHDEIMEAFGSGLTSKVRAGEFAVTWPPCRASHADDWTVAHDVVFITRHGDWLEKS